LPNVIFIISIFNFCERHNEFVTWPKLNHYFNQPLNRLYRRNFMKPSFAVLVLAVFCSSIASASPLSDMMNPQDNILAYSMSGKKAKQLSPNKCVNFAGNWQGSCVSGATTTPSRMEIKQTNCSGMTWVSGTENTSIEMTGLSIAARSQSGALASWSLSYAAGWDTKKETLQLEAVALVASPLLETPATQVIEVLVMFDGSDLVALSKNTGNTPSGNSQVACRYKKQ
jgi:hypothetical protein